MKSNLVELKTIIKQEIRSILKEEATIYKLDGILVTDTTIRTQEEILSDIRSILGITIVSSKHIKTNNTAVKNSYYYSSVTIKIDPHPYIGKGGFNREQLDGIIEQIKKVKGVRTFKLKSEPIKTTL